MIWNSFQERSVSWLEVAVGRTFALRLPGLRPVRGYWALGLKYMHRLHRLHRTWRVRRMKCLLGGGGGVAGGEDTPTVSRVSWIEGSETGYAWGSHIPSGCVGPALNIPSELNTVSTSLISGVPDSIKNKIWEGRYVDLALLVFKQDATLAFDVGQGEGAAQLVVHHSLVVHQRAAGEIRTIAEWHRDFARFHAILIRVQPHLSEALTAHVGKIAGIGGDCLTYDETYRLGVSEGVIKWGQMNVDLSLDAVLFSRGGQWRGFRGEPQRVGALRVALLRALRLVIVLLIIVGVSAPSLRLLGSTLVRSVGPDIPRKLV